MRSLILMLGLGLTLATFGAGGCCRGCAEKADLDFIPGMKDSGIPDPKAAKEHEKEIEQINKELEEIGREMAEVATDPTLSEAEKERRMEKLGKDMEIRAERLEKIAEDIANRDL